MAEKWTTVIKPKSGWFDINLKEVWAYRDLTMLFVKRNFIAQRVYITVCKFCQIRPAEKIAVTAL